MTLLQAFLSEGFHLKGDKDHLKIMICVLGNKNASETTSLIR